MHSGGGRGSTESSRTFEVRRAWRTVPQRPAPTTGRTTSVIVVAGEGHRFTDRTAELALFGTVEHHLPCRSAGAISSCAGSSAC